MKLIHHPRAALRRMTAEYQSVTTPFGPALIAVTGDSLCWLKFAEADEGIEALRLYWQGGLAIPATRDLQPLADAIFAERHEELEVLVTGTEFQHSAWRELARVAHGETVTYGELARRMGRPQASRPVGGAMGANPVAYVLPCHRVLGSTGALHGFACGLPLKHALLAAEGVRAAA